ncbi:MAG: C13 family peptidase, partial [candidate division KSB1 bacterium]|nr:C13 family peptidase [candidate division KSB1 bacterium]
MKTVTKSYTLIILFALLFMSMGVEPVLATSAKPGNILGPRYYSRGLPVELQFEVINDSVLAMDNYDCDVIVKDSTGEKVFEENVKGSNLPPYTTDTLSTQTSWTPEETGKYQISVEVNFRWDVILDDNIRYKDQTVIYERDIFASKLEHDATKMSSDTSSTMAFMGQSVLEPGTTVQSYDTTELSLSLDDYAYLGYIDFDKSARFSHPTAAILYDAVDTTKADTFQTNYWLLTGGVEYALDEGTDLVYGSSPEARPVESSSTLYQPDVDYVLGDSICAILVSGEGKDATEQAAFDYDLELVANNLTMESLGPRLPPSSVVQMKNPTADQVEAKLDSMQKKYKKVYFYYSGHGSRGYANLNGGPLFYATLANRLFGIRASDLVLLLDTCHSGSAIDAFKEFSISLERTNVTLITACAADTVSYTDRIFITATGDTIRAGLYTWNFVLCYGDPEAESDGIPGISEKETFEWVKKNNPAFGSSTINEKLRPQMFINVATRPRTRVIGVPPADLTIHQNERMDSTAYITVQMQTDLFDTTTTDANIESFSDYRYWSLKTDYKGSGYDWGLEFKYNLDY